MRIKQYLGNNYREIILQDDDTPYGGTAYIDETLGEFMDSIGLEGTQSMKQLNIAVKDCGIKTLEIGDYYE